MDGGTALGDRYRVKEFLKRRTELSAQKVFTADKIHMLFPCPESHDHIAFGGMVAEHDIRFFCFGKIIGFKRIFFKKYDSEISG